tara:strand:+ start:97255 stop:97383 length:129 start_codon:yes stop_codon:yes gene_type:complete
LEHRSGQYCRAGQFGWRTFGYANRREPHSMGRYERAVRWYIQ